MEAWDRHVGGLGDSNPHVFPVLVQLHSGPESMVNIIPVVPKAEPCRPPPPSSPALPQVSLPTLQAQQHFQSSGQPFDIYQIGMTQSQDVTKSSPGETAMWSGPVAQALMENSSAGSSNLTMDDLMQSSIVHMGDSTNDLRDVSATGSALKPSYSASSEEFNLERLRPLPSKGSLFSTARGRPLVPSAAALSRALELFVNDEIGGRGAGAERNGFNIGGGKQLGRDHSTDAGRSQTGTQSHTLQTGAQSHAHSSLCASGQNVGANSIIHPDKFLLGAGKLEVPQTLPSKKDEETTELPPRQAVSLFSSGLGKPVLIKGDSLQRAKAVFEECPSDYASESGRNSKADSRPLITSSNSVPSVTSLFSSGSGKQVMVSVDSLQRSRSILDGISDAPPVSLTSQQTVFPSLFSSGAGKPVVVTKEALNRSKALFDEAEGSALLSAPSRESCTPLVPFADVGIPNKQILRAQEISSSGSSKISIKQSHCKGFRPPQRIQQTNYQSTPNLSSVALSSEGSTASMRPIPTPTPSPSSVNSTHLLPLSSSFLSSRLVRGTSSRNSAKFVRSLVTAPPPLARAVLSAKFLAAACSPRAEFLHRAPILVDSPLAEGLHQHGLLPYISFPLPSSVPGPSTPLNLISPSNSVLVYFDAWGRPQLPALERQAPLIPPGPYPPRGEQAMKNFALATPSVLRAHALFLASGADPKLATPIWVCNAYRWVVAKLGDLEFKAGCMAAAKQGKGGSSCAPVSQAQPLHSLSGLLSWDAVVSRLAWRYEKEFFRGFKSPLARIYAGDAPASSHLILSVAKISVLGPNPPSQSPLSIPAILELTDGWCSIGGVPCDPHIASLVVQGTIKLGTVLRVACCELVGATLLSPASPVTGPNNNIKGFASSRSGGFSGEILPPGFFPNPAPISHSEASWNFLWPRAVMRALLGSEPVGPWEEWGGTIEEVRGGGGNVGGVSALTTAPSLLSTGDPLISPTSRYLTLRYNSVRPAPWYSRLGAPSIPHFLTPISSLRPGGGPVSAVQGVLSRRRACKYLVTREGGKGAMDAVEAQAVMEAARKCAGESLECALRELAKSHDDAIKEVSRRAKAARIYAKSSTPLETKTIVQPDFERVRKGSEELGNGESQLSQGGLSGWPWGENDIGLAKHSVEEGAKVSLERSFALSRQSLIESFGKSGGVPSTASTDSHSTSHNDPSPITSVPFTTLLFLDTNPAHAAVRAGCMALKNSHAQEGNGSSHHAQISAAEITLWRVNEEGASAYTEGQTYTVCGLGVGVRKGGAIRLSSSKETFFREVGCSWKEGSMESFLPYLAHPQHASDCATSHLEETSINKLFVDPSTLAMSASGYSPRSRVLLSHAPAVVASTSHLATFSQMLLNLASRNFVCEMKKTREIESVCWVNEDSGKEKATLPSECVTARDTDGFALPTPRSTRSANYSSNNRNSRVTSEASAAFSSNFIISLLKHLYPPSDAPLDPTPASYFFRGLSVWSVICQNPRRQQELSITEVKDMWANYPPRLPPYPSSSQHECELDLVVLVLAVSPARNTCGDMNVATPIVPMVSNPSNLHVEWEIFLTDESGMVGQCSFSTPLTTRTSLTGFGMEGSPLVPLTFHSQPPSAPPLSLGSIVSLRDVKFLHYGLGEGLCYLKWGDAASVQPHTSRPITGTTARRLSMGMGAGIGKEVAPNFKSSLQEWLASSSFEKDGENLSKSQLLSLRAATTSGYSNLMLPKVDVPSSGSQIIETLRKLLQQELPLPPPIIPIPRLIYEDQAAPLPIVPPFSSSSTSSSSSLTANSQFNIPQPGSFKRNISALLAADANALYRPIASAATKAIAPRFCFPTKFICSLLLPPVIQQLCLSPVPPKLVPLVLMGKSSGSEGTASLPVPSSHPALSPPTVYSVHPPIGPNTFFSTYVPMQATPNTTTTSYRDGGASIGSTCMDFYPSPSPSSSPPPHFISSHPAPDICAHPFTVKMGKDLATLSPPIRSHLSAPPRFLLSLRLPLVYTPTSANHPPLLLFTHLSPPVTMNYLLGLLNQAAGGVELLELESALCCPQAEKGDTSTPRLAALLSLLESPPINPPSLPLSLRCLAHTLLFSTLKSSREASSDNKFPVQGCVVCDAARPPAARIPLTPEEWSRITRAFLNLLASYPSLQCSVYAKSSPGATGIQVGMVGGSLLSVGLKTSESNESNEGRQLKDRDWKDAVDADESAWRAFEPMWEASCISHSSSGR